MQTIEKKPALNRPPLWRIAKILALVVLAGAALFLILHAHQFLNRRLLTQMERTLHSFGAWAPLGVVALIILSTAIPPLPLPVPLVEMAAGLLFGFGEGFGLVWIAQMVASLFAFFSTRLIGQRFFKSLLANKLVAPFQRYVQEGGPLGVTLMRATMAAPFNSISYLAGITGMKVSQFTLATAVGILTEATLYPLVGSILRPAHLSLPRVFILVVIVGAIGPVATYALTRILKSRKQPVAVEVS